MIYFANIYKIVTCDWLVWHNHMLGGKRNKIQTTLNCSLELKYKHIFSPVLLNHLCILIEIVSILGKCLLFFKQGFVLAVTVVREAVDEFRRYQRDKEMNSQFYSKLTIRGWQSFFPYELCISIHVP